MTCNCKPLDEPCHPHSPPDYGVDEPKLRLSFRGPIRHFRLWLRELLK